VNVEQLVAARVTGIGVVDVPALVHSSMQQPKPL